MVRWIERSARAGATVVLLTYTTVLALGCWNENVRPSFLDAAHTWAIGFWNAVGIPPGQAVFSGRGLDRKALVEHRVTVVPFFENGRGAPIAWRKNAGRTFARTYDPAEVLVVRLITQADYYPPPRLQLPPQRANQRRLMRSLGRHFLSRLEPEERARAQRLVGHWSLDYLEYATGRRFVTERFAAVWTVGKGMDCEVIWDPTPEQIEAVGLGVDE